MTSMVNPRRCALGGAILLAGCLLLTACASGSAPSASSSSGAQAAPARLAAPHSAAGNAFGGSAGANSAAGANSTAGSGGTGLTAGLTPANQNIIYTAAVTIRADSVAATARRITGIAVAAGGYISAENAGSAGPGGTGETIDITLKIPVPSYPAVLAQLSSPALGKQLSMNQHATDVTQEVANVSSLVASQQDAITALEGLLGHAASVADLLQVQQQISLDETTLNSLLAQQRALNGETSYATVTMTLVSPHHAGPPPTGSRHSFLTGLLAGWRALRHAAAWVATAIGAALPFLAILAALGAAGYVAWRRYLRRRAGPAAPAA
jgi:Domain of unknown function (DUF4349)